jgi:hypothetical protein
MSDQAVKSVSKPAVCRVCGASILWVSTGRGKKRPLDILPSPAGTSVITRLIDGSDIAVYLSPSNAELYDDGRPRYTSHIATCPGRYVW